MAISSLLAVNGCGAQSAPAVPADWKTDCVGRMQVSLPGEVEMGAHLMENFMTDSKPDLPNVSTQLQYPDGVKVWYGPGSWYDGSVVLSQSLNKKQFDNLWDSASRVRAESIRNSNKLPDYLKSGTPLAQPAILKKSKGITWGLYGYGAVLQVGDHMLLWRSAGNIDRSANTFQSLDENSSSRKVFDIPNASGVCLPYIFIQDGNKTYRNIAMTYRLVDHPDVQITIKDSSAAKPEPGIRTQNAEPLPVIQSLWDQHLTLFAKDGKNEWARGGHPVTLAGYKGLSSFVKFIRHDDTVDYGYAAVVRGDPRRWRCKG